MLLDAADVGRLVVLKRAEIRCQAALVDCEKREPVKEPTPWLTYGGVALGIFAGGVVVGVVAR